MDNNVKVEEDITNSSTEITDITSKKNNSLFKGLGAAFGGLLLILSKFKFALAFILGKCKFLIVILKFLKIGKFLATFGSMALTIWLYAKCYGLPFAVGFVLLIYFHEMGHYLMAKRENLDVSAPLFIPGLGAFIRMKEMPKSVLVEAKTALVGPLLGSFAALICFIIYLLTKNDLFLGLAYSGFFINLFNLIPMHPFDGGRISSIISKKIWLVGIPLMIFVNIKFFNPLLILFTILGICTAYKEFKNPNKEYYSTNSYTKHIFSIMYFSLVILLGLVVVYIKNFMM